MMARSPVEVSIASDRDSDRDSSADLSDLAFPGDASVMVPGPDSLAARERIAQIRRSEDAATIQNPFFYHSGEEVEFELEDSDEPIDTSMPTMELSGLMGGQTPLAIINGQMRRVGDTIENGWVLVKIEPVARCVIVRGPDGREVTIDGRERP